MRTRIIIILTFFSIFAEAQIKEELKYHMRYSFFRGGEATLKIQDTTYNNQAAIHYLLDGNTVGLANALFGVHDIYESIVDPETFLPHKAIRNIKEGNYKYYNEAFFFNQNDSIYTTRSGGKKVPPKVVDFVTAFFYMRFNNYMENLNPGDTFTIPVFHADDFFMMKVEFTGTATIKSKLGKKECYVIKPRVDKGKILNTSKGLKFYITKDEDRIPLLLRFDMKIGALKCELYSYKKLGVEQIH